MAHKVLPLLLLLFLTIHESISQNHNVTASNSTDDALCKNLTMDSPWEEQIKIHPCHRQKYTHPRQQPRNRRTPEEQERFHHLALYNIKYDVDFQEAGQPCSVRLQNEWLNAPSGPVNLSEYSFNDIWYKRLCSFFSFLECIPKDQARGVHKPDPPPPPAGRTLRGRSMILRGRSMGLGELGPLEEDKSFSTTEESGLYASNRTKRDADEDEENDKISIPLLEYNDSGIDTKPLMRLVAGGRGPAKGRHRSGPGGGRLDAQALIGTTEARQVEGYPLDGICACSAFDPKFPDRPRSNRYGMNFVEDEARPKWCVSAPGGLCGRVYFQRNTWPGQDFEMSDHIGCPLKYNGTEYECVRWTVPEENRHKHEFSDGDKPMSLTSTCEKKTHFDKPNPDDDELEHSKAAFVLVNSWFYVCSLNIAVLFMH